METLQNETVCPRPRGKLETEVAVRDLMDAPKSCGTGIALDEQAEEVTAASTVASCREMVMTRDNMFKGGEEKCC